MFIQVFSEQLSLGTFIGNDIDLASRLFLRHWVALMERKSEQVTPEVLLIR